jgi:hypothetical protein
MSEFGVRVSQGRKPAYADFRKFGYNPNVGTSEEYIGPRDGPWRPTEATVIDVSGSNDDSPGGTGAQEIMIEGLGANYEEIWEPVMMNGQVPVPTVQPFLRFHRAYVTDSGGDNNVGKILFRAGDVIADIKEGFGQTQLSGYCVPRRRKLLITGVNTVIASSKVVDVIFWQNPGTKRIVQQYNGLVGATSFSYDPPIPFTPRTDLWFTGKTADVSTVSVEYTGYLSRD